MQHSAGLTDFIGLGHLLQLFPKSFGGKAQMTLQYLTHVHTRRNTQGIEHQINRAAVGKKGHILFGQKPGHHALVAMTSCHFVTNREFPLGGNVNLDHFDHAGRQVVTLFHALGNALIAFAHLICLICMAGEDGADLVLVFCFFSKIQGVQLRKRYLIDYFTGKLLAQFQDDLALCVLDITLSSTTLQKDGQSLAHPFLQAEKFGLHIPVNTIDLHLFDHHCAFILVHAFAGKDLGINDHTFYPRRHSQGGILDITGLFAKDGAQELFLRRKHGFTLGGDLAHQHIARLHLSTDADDARIIKVAQPFLTNVGNISGDFFLAQLGVAGHGLENLNVYRSKGVFFEEALIDENRVLEVVAAPRHEGHGHILAQSQFPAFSRRPIGQYLPLHHPLPRQYHRLLVKAGVLVRLFVFEQSIHPDTGLKAVSTRLVIANNYPVGVGLLHDTTARRKQTGPGVAGHVFFHSGPNQRGAIAQQGHSLTLHVRAHEGAVGIVVLQKGNQ